VEKRTIHLLVEQTEIDDRLVQWNGDKKVILRGINMLKPIDVRTAYLKKYRNAVLQANQGAV